MKYNKNSMKGKNFMEKPFVLVTVPLALGIVYYFFVKVNPTFLFITLMIILAIYILSIIFKSNNNYIYIILTFFILGIFITYIQGTSSRLQNFINKNVIVEGIVIKGRNEENGLNKYIILADNINLDNKSYIVKEKLVLTIVGETNIKVGERITFNGILEEPKKNTNPKMFNYKLHLLSHKIHTTSIIKDYSILKIESQELPWYLRVKLMFMEKVDKTFDDYLSIENSLLMKSIVLGDYSYLDGNIAEKYRELGLSHIMAISGLHIGIISMFLIRLMGYAGLDRRINYSITILVIWIYGYFVDFPPSVIRSNIMFTILFCSKITAEKFDSINTLLFSMFVVLIWNPFWLFNIGFQLSFMVTLSIIILTPAIKNKFYPYKNSIINSLSGIIAAQLGSLPIIAYYFNTISLVSIFANLVVVPVLSLCLILSFLLIFLSVISEVLASSLGIILNFLLYIQNIVTDFIQSLPFVSMKVVSPKFINILLYYFIILCIFNIIDLYRVNREVKKIIVYYLVIFVVGTSFIHLSDDTLAVNFVDVGQGDCILIEKDNRAFLVDTGGSFFNDSSIGKNIVLPYLMKKGIFKIDGMFISHFHLDHCESLLYLMEHLKIEEIYISYEEENNSLYNDILMKGREQDIPIVKLLVGDKYYVDKNTYFEVISPDNLVIEKEKLNENNKSMVLMLNSHNQRVLFTGDIEEEVEMYLSNKIDYTIDFLKVPHHGSDTSSSSIFIDRVKPKYAFIQVGKNNFGHPSEEVLKNYKDRGIIVYRNDLYGHIEVLINKDDYLINPYNKEKFSIIELIVSYSFIISYNIVYLIIAYTMIKKYTVVMERLKIIDL